MTVAKAFLYTRISTLQQVKGYGIERQQTTVLDFLDEAILPPQLGYTISGENYEMLEADLGKSAFKGHNFSKGHLGKFKERVLSGEIVPPAIFIIENVDRFSRLPDYEAIHEFNVLIRAGIDVYEVETGNTYSTKLDGTLSKLSVSIERAHQESKRKSNMAKKSWIKRRKDIAENQTVLKNNYPRWLSIESGRYKVDEVQVNIIRTIFTLYAEGHGNSPVVQRMNNDGLYDNGKPWTTITLHRILRDKRLIGIHTVGKGREKTIPVLDSAGNPVLDSTGKAILKANTDTLKAYPEVIDEVLFNKVQRMIDSKSGTRKTTKYMRNLFNGISKCGKCGSPLIADKNGHGRLFFLCLKRRHEKSCDAMNVPYDITERHILVHARGIDWSRLYQTGSNDTAVVEGLVSEMKDIQGQIDEVEEELKTSDDDMVIPLVRLLKKKRASYKELQEKVEGLERQVPMVFDFNVDEVANQENVELRQNANIHLKKTIKSILIGRDANHVTLDFEYYTDVIKHVLFTKSKGDEWISTLVIQRGGDTYAYETPSFGLYWTVGDIQPEIRFGVESLSAIDWGLLLNYIDGIEGHEVVADWMRSVSVKLFS